MKTDRELVDAAAKAGIAAGMRLSQRGRSGAQAPRQWMLSISSAGGPPLEMPWEPLDTDIDACSLIVSMPLAVDFDDSTVYIHYCYLLIWEAVYSGAEERPQITRRAIVIAIASINQPHR